MKHLFAILALLHGSLVTAHAEPVRLIFDTDMRNDVDDVMALIAIHTLQSVGACEPLAVTLAKDHPQAAAFTDAVNTFYGRADLPIASCVIAARRSRGASICSPPHRDRGARPFRARFLEG